MKAVLFDLDGTLTDCRIDYPTMRADLGIGPGPVLEQIDLADPATAAVLERHELAAARASVPAAGARELVGDLAVPAAIVTRNSAAGAALTLASIGLSFDAVVSRETTPRKPHPHAVRHAASLLGVAPADCLMVGDTVHDVAAGHAAGAATVWLSLGRDRDFEPAATWEVRDLPALHRLMQTDPATRGLLRGGEP